MRDAHPAEWTHEARERLSTHPVAENKGELPQKRVFGSDFPFRDKGQLESLSVEAGGNSRSVSGAFGGFSNVWGAQVMPFSRATLESWAIGYEATLPHYRAILEHIPFAGADDDYSELFPLLAPADPLPTLAPPAAASLRRYAERRSRIRRGRDGRPGALGNTLASVRGVRPLPHRLPIRPDLLVEADARAAH